METVRLLWLIMMCVPASPVFAQPSLLKKFFYRGTTTTTIGTTTTGFPLPLCSVSAWSKWAVKGFGGYERYRILQNPAASPSNCSVHLVENKAGPKPTLTQIGDALKNNFLRREGQTCKDFTVCTKQLKAILKEQQHMMRDLLLIVDSSGSIGQTNFDKAKDSLATLMGLLCPKYGTTDPFKSSSLNYHQAALINFAEQAIEKWDFDDKHPTSILKSAIKNINYFTAGIRKTCTNLAFKKAISMFGSNVKGLRHHSSIKKEVLIITDGLSNCGTGTAIQAAKDLRDAYFGPNNDQVNVYALLIGKYDGKGQAEAKQYVSQPLGNHLFNLPTYNDLHKLVNDLVAAAPPCVHLTSK